MLAQCLVEGLHGPTSMCPKPPAACSAPELGPPLVMLLCHKISLQGRGNEALHLFEELQYNREGLFRGRQLPPLRRRAQLAAEVALSAQVRVQCSSAFA